MGSFKVEKFGGSFPAWDPRFLPDDQASFSLNTYLYSGAAIGWRVPKLLRTLLNSAAKYAFRIPVISQGTAGATLTVTGPIAGDTVTVGEITYTYTATPTNPFDVLLGSTPTKSAEALYLALQYGSFDKTLVGNNTQANPAVAAQSPVLGEPFAFVAGTNTPGANTIVLVQVIPSGTMKLNSVSCVPQATQGAANFEGVVYESVNQINSAGTAYINIPTTLIGTGAQVTGCTAGVSLTSTLPVPVTLQGGSVYFIGLIMDTAIPLQLASSGLDAVSNDNTYTAGPPNPFQTTELSGVTTGGSTVGTLQTSYNLNQPNWQIWANMTTISSTDPVNTIAGNVLSLEAPAFGTAYNQTPIASNNATRLSWGGATFFAGGANQTADTTITGNSKWLEFLDQDTNVVRTPVVDDTFQRYYFASPSLPPQYNTYDRIAAGLPPYYLGVPAPPIAPTVTTTGGGNPTQVGFPGSTTATVYNLPTVAVIPNGMIVLYPMQVSVSCSVVDIGIMLNSIGPSGTADIIGAIYADGANVDGGTPGVPSDLIADGAVNAIVGSTYTPNGGATPLPAKILSPFSVDAQPVLSANTQYWIGVSIGGAVDNTVNFSLGDTGTKGFSSTLSPSIDPNTGQPQAPVMTPNFPDLQLWADLIPGTTGEAQEETRAYVYTWVTAYGEEGPPSPPALLDAYDNATWVVGLQPPLAEDMGTLRNIVSTNIYRTMSSVQGGTVFFLVGTLAATATVFVDTVTDDVAATNLIIPSTTWYGPPTTLQGMITMPNGMIAGFVGNEVWFCEPFRPHAWPSGYVMTTDYPIVGLGVTGTALVACTNTNPNVFNGVNPSVMSQSRIALAAPCTARGGILSTENGVYYPSINGLIKVLGGGSAVNTTQSWITREKWDQLTPQKFVRAIKNVSAYFAFGTTGVTNGQADDSVAQQGFSIELSEVADQQSFTLWPQVGGHRIGFSTLDSPLDINVDNVLSDPWSSVALLIAGGAVYQYDFTDPAPQITPALWRSKKFQGPHRDNFAAFRVWFDIPPGGPQTPPATRTTVSGTDNPPTVPALAFVTGMFGVVRIIADGLYVTERELRYSTELMRIASDQKWTTWQVEIEGIVSVTNIKVATTVKELGTMK